jgi:3-hydroxyacyl-[acyl-carrier-protein] dehydratase
MTARSLRLGPDVIERLIPHRRPFLMVDTVDAYEGGPRPTLRAARHVSANEPVFEGHFPGLHLWPGVYTIEGMGQTCNLLHVIASLEAGWDGGLGAEPPLGEGGERGEDPEQLFAALQNLELGYKLAPGFRWEGSARLLAALADPDLPSRMGMSAAVDVKLLAPVFAGQRLDYQVTQTHLVEGMIRFEVRAEVEGRSVARGVMTSTRGVRFPMAP